MFRQRLTNIFGDSPYKFYPFFASTRNTTLNLNVYISIHSL